jgi:putative ABC transport system permease protein
VRQLLTEGLLLAVAGAALGILLAEGLIALLVRLAPADLPRFDAVDLDGRVLLFTLGASLLTVLVFALVPALQSSRVDLHDAIKSGTRLAGGERRARARRLLVAGEIALSLVLLVGAGLMVRSFSALQAARPGFEASDLVTFQLALPNVRYPNPPDHARFFEKLSEQVQAQPGIQAFSASFPLPMSGRFWTNEYSFDPRTEESWGTVESDNHVVLPGYFRALGARVLKGREISWEDVKEGRKVVVVDDLLAQKAFPGEDPIGRHLKVRSAAQDHESAEIVGVVEHVRQDHPGHDGREQTYATLGLWPFNSLYFVVRSPLPPARVAEIVRGEVRKIDPGLALYDVRTLRGYMAEVTAGQRFAMQLLGLFAALAAALALSRVLSSLLYGVSPADPPTYGAIVLCVAALALLASYVPALRVARLHPARVLRSE